MLDTENTNKKSEMKMLSTVMYTKQNLFRTFRSPRQRELLLEEAKYIKRM
jgi:hypothetical protein